jgi:hypothetical protein
VTRRSIAQRVLGEDEARELSEYVENLRTEQLGRGRPGPGFRGRPSLTQGEVAHSPSIHVRLPAPLYRKLSQRANASGKTMSTVVREILQKHAPRVR